MLPGFESAAPVERQDDELPIEVANEWPSGLESCDLDVLSLPTLPRCSAALAGESGGGE